MLACWIVGGGFLIALGVGGLIVEHPKVARLIDRLTCDLPMNWVRIEHFEEFRDQHSLFLKRHARIVDLPNTITF